MNSHWRSQVLLMNVRHNGNATPGRHLEQSDRNGSALVVVLVVIAMLSLGAYTFSESMITEYHAATAYGRQKQTLALAHSGLEYVAALLSQGGLGRDENLSDNAALFHVAVVDGGGFSIVSPIDETIIPTSQGTQSGQWSLGLMDESAKIPLNALADLDPSTGEARNMLMTIPGMTETLADQILDWIDADDDPREFGAELESYDAIFPRNGPIESLDELLLISEITPELLYGEDANRNGLLDANENDGDQSLPLDNQDGVLDRGWEAYLTLVGKESNFQHAAEAYGLPKINLNDEDLENLYDQLEAAFDTEVAMFVTAYRLFGDSQSAGGNSSSGGSSAGGGSSRGSGSSSGQNATAGGNSGGGRLNSGRGGSRGSGGSSGGSTTGSSDTSDGGTNDSPGSGAPTGNSGGRGASGSSSSSGGQSTTTSGQGGNSSQNGDSSGSAGTVMRNGLDLSANGSVKINSLYDLIGAQVTARIDGQDQTLTSPWDDDPSSLVQLLAVLEDQLSTSDEPEIAGRININFARPEVLAAIPDMPEDVAAAIVSARSEFIASGVAADERFATTGWLLADGIVDLPTMRLLAPYITSRGDVFRMQIVGHFDQPGAVSRLEAVIDASQPIPKILFMRSLTELGTGVGRKILPAFNQTEESRISR